MNTSNLRPTLALYSAGIMTIALVWYVAAHAQSTFFGLSGGTVAQLACGAFALCFLTTDLVSTSGARWINMPVQALSATAVMIVAPGSVGPILNIIVVSQLPFLFGLRRAAIGAVVLVAIQFTIMVAVWSLTPSNALITSALYGCFFAFAILIVYHAQRAEQARGELAEVNAELLATRSLLEESARDRERLRVSRELHDVAGHTLTALKLNLRQLTRGLTGDQRGLAAESLALADDLLEDIRALVGNLRRFDGVDLRDSIRQLTAPFAAPRFEFDFADQCEAPDLASAQALLAVAREAITNVVRHAQATRCTIELNILDTHLTLRVEDNGRGMRNLQAGSGLRGMRERLQAVGGELALGPADLGGTRVEARIGGAA